MLFLVVPPLSFVLSSRLVCMSLRFTLSLSSVIARKGHAVKGKADAVKGHAVKGKADVVNDHAVSDAPN